MNDVTTRWTLDEALQAVGRKVNPSRDWAHCPSCQLTADVAEPIEHESDCPVGYLDHTTRQLLEALKDLMWRFEGDDSDPHDGEVSADIAAARIAIDEAQGRP